MIKQINKSVMLTFLIVIQLYSHSSSEVNGVNIDSLKNLYISQYNKQLIISIDVINDLLDNDNYQEDPVKSLTVIVHNADKSMAPVLFKLLRRQKQVNMPTISGVYPNLLYLKKMALGALTQINDKTVLDSLKKIAKNKTRPTSEGWTEACEEIYRKDLSDAINEIKENKVVTNSIIKKMREGNLEYELDILEVNIKGRNINNFSLINELIKYCDERYSITIRKKAIWKILIIDPNKGIIALIKSIDDPNVDIRMQYLQLLKEAYLGKDNKAACILIDYISKKDKSDIIRVSAKEVLNNDRPDRNISR